MNAKDAKDDIRDVAPDPAAPERLNEFLRRWLRLMLEADWYG